jgi:predicted  nucleic acid-binding Zn-ribbon protein
MNELQRLALKIDEFRKYLQNLIAEKENLADGQILYASEELDDLLNEYERFKRNMN